MINHKEHAELVKKAQLGDKECLNRLAEAARVHLREYVLRLTLQEDLTQDIVQESILEMFKVFDKLKNAEKFWAWLDGIAFNKIRSHYGRQWRHKTISLSKISHEITTEDNNSALADMVNHELKQIVIKSMRELSPRHRAVLTMRCYREMPYSEIARLMGCTEFGAQSLFYRAKKALAKKLSSHGLGKGYLLPALVLFGKLTATTEATAANISITASTLKVSTAAAIAAIATSKTAVVSLVTAGLIAGGTIAVTQGTAGIDNGLQSARARTLINTPNQIEAGTDTEQCWYFFPEGTGGPVMMRLMKFSDSGEDSYCQYLQNQSANYYYDKNTIYINNSRMYSPELSVARLPTDGEDLSQFISQVEGKPTDIEYISSSKKGLLIISKSSNDRGNRIWRIDRHFNVLEEEYFQFNWPESTRIVDNRDIMHKRGWTYFRIAGHINGKEVTGTGRMPFVYATSRRFGPWLKLQLKEGSKIVDTPKEACVLDKNSNVMARYEAGSFFEGLGRPWMGLHTIDTVRRDAAEKQVRFETIPIPDSRKTEVVLMSKKIKLVYTINMETDVIEKITFSADDDGEGELRFSYLQDIENIGDEFASPRSAGQRSLQKDSPGVLWPVKLINNRW
jgi:RNA polymerase sigma-70 factor (ECF subfamily)